MARLLDQLPPRLQKLIAKVELSAARDSTFLSRYHSGEVDENDKPLPRNPDLVERSKSTIIASRRTCHYGLRTKRRTRSYFGGKPSLPPGLAWPTHGCERLSFIAQVDLAELNQSGHLDWLPRTGSIMFFAGRSESGVWDASISCVVYNCEDQILEDVVSERLDCVYLTFERGDSYTLHGCEHWPAQADDYLELQNWYLQLLPPHHQSALWQVGGWPKPLQDDDMQEECERRFRRLDWNNPAALNAPDFQQAKLTWQLTGQFDLEQLTKTPDGFRRGFFWLKIADGQALFPDAILIGQSD